MGRLSRILLNVTTVVSLVLCVAALSLSVRSYWRSDYVQWARYVRETQVARGEEQGAGVYATVDVRSNRGRVMVEWARLDSPYPDYPTWTHTADEPSPASPGGTFWTRLGFGQYSTNPGPPGFAVPWWFVALCFGVPALARPAVSFSRRRLAGAGAFYRPRARPRSLRILLNGVTVASLLFWAATLVVWAESRGGYPSAAWASGRRASHVTARGGMLWVARTEWPNDADARRAATGPARAARPVLVAPYFQQEEMSLMIERQVAADRARGERDPVRRLAWALRGEKLKTAFHDGLVRRAGGPPAEPLLAQSAPVTRHKLGLTFEQGKAAFPHRERDGAIVYNTSVPYSATGVPLWALLLPPALVPVARMGGWVVRLTRARSKRLRGLCPVCGYDLRESPDRCPECGTFRPLVGTSG
jgi:hypothetical protein